MNNKLGFNDRCYALLCEIPVGKVTTYKAIAAALGTKAWRAVGTAMAKNTNPIVVPCHRVVRSDGFIGGFALGKNNKIALLEKEGVKVVDDKIKDFDLIFFDFTE